MEGLIDAVYQRMRGTGPEFEGWLSNHGPMAADALVRLGRADEVEHWVDGYLRRLDAAPRPRWDINESEWREVIGDPSRLGDWQALFLRQVREEPWQDLLVRWWPRLLPGAVASAAHGLIRTGHATRALREVDTPQRRDELAQALGYWAARWQRLPHPPGPAGTRAPMPALDAVPTLDVEGGIRVRLAALEESSSWSHAVAGLRPVPAVEDVPAALDALVDAAVARYGDWAHGSPIMLVHAATGPRAAALVLPSLPRELWMPTHDLAWAVAAALATIYRPTGPGPVPSPDERAADTPDAVADLAVATGDEHAIKFTEVALESHRRGNPAAVSAAARAASLIGVPD